MHPNCKSSIPPAGSKPALGGPRLNLPLAIILALCCANPASAAVVILKGSSQVLMGYLVRQDDNAVTLREVLPGGKSKETTFNRGQIDELILTVSPDRLTALNPSQPAEYLEYAEELAEKLRDPEARETALRLYAIAASRGDDLLRHSALLGLISLARSPTEERQLRAAAYLFDPSHDETLLKTGEATTATPALGSLADLLTALKLIRQGKGTQARIILDKPAVRSDAAKLSSIITLDELADLSTASQLSNPQLLRVLRAETALEELKLGRSAIAAASSDPSQWSAILRPGGMSPLPALSLTKLTEFDPANCVFRGGKWTKP